MMNYLTIDFGGTLVKYSVMNQSCETLLRGEEPAPLESRQAFLNLLHGLYKKSAAEFAIGGIAISMPGVIDADTGYARSAGAYYHLYEMDLMKELDGRIPVPVSVENDGKCGALAEVWMGNLKDCNDGIVLILGTAAGGGIIKNREIHRGKSLSAGEFSSVILGDTVAPRNQVWAKCGVSPLLFEAMRRKGIDVKKHPHYKMYAEILPVEQTLTEWNRKPEYDHGMDGYQFFALLEKGDPEIQRLYEEYISHLSLLIFNLQVIYAPEKILIGGGISRQSRLIPDLRVQYERIHQNTGTLLTFPCHLDRCLLGNEANQYGALYHFLNKYPNVKSGQISGSET